MRVTDVDVRETATGTRVTAELLWDDRRRNGDRIEFVYRDTASHLVATPGDALLAAVVVPAMAVGEDVTIDAPVSERLLGATPRVVGEVARAVPRWQRISVDAPVVSRSSLAPTEVASAFSGGVDSFYTAIRARSDPVTVLVTVHGLEYENLVPQLEPWVQRLARVARALGKRHLVVETNGYAVGRRHLPWTGPRGVAIVGPLVIASALGIGALIRRLHVGATRAPTEVRPDFVGTSPEIDPLFSTESLEVIHDGSAERYDKIRMVASCPVALAALQVCSRRRERVDNCNRCDKCVATALALQAFGVIDRCPTLRRVSPDDVRRTTVNPNWVHTFTLLRGQVDDPEMRNAIASALRKARLRRPLRPVGVALRRAGLRRGRG